MPNRLRIEMVAKALSKIPYGAIDVVETSDPQYAAVKMIARRHGDRAAALVVANALVSYRLSLPGEEYWREFAEFVARKPAPRSSKDIEKIFEEFFMISKGNRRLLPQKLARLRKAAPVLERLLANPEAYRDLRRLVEELASTYSGRGTEKTIVFAAKMLHYLHRVLSVEEYNLDSVPVPIDRRMALLTYTSGIIDARPEVIMTRLRDEAVSAWLEVAREAGIPAVSLDAVVWLPAYRIESLLAKDIEIARDEYAKRLMHYTKGLVRWSTARRIAEEILHRGIY